MIPRLLICAVVMATPVPAETAGKSRLQFAVPTGWVRSQDPTSQAVVLTPPGGNAFVLFMPGKEFAGTAEQWLNAMWNDLRKDMTLLTPPQSGRQGAFLTRMGVFQQADQTRLWVCVYSRVHDGRGEGVIFCTSGDGPFLAHLATVNQMAYGMTVAAAPPAPASATPPASSPTTPPPAAPAPAGSASNTAPSSHPPPPAAKPESGRPPVADRSSPAGLYLATTRQFRLNIMGPPGSGSWTVATEYYLLSRDGRVFHGRDLPNAPGGDISRFDYEAARREAPGAYGTYAVNGNEITLRMGESGETVTARKVGDDSLEIRNTTYKRSIREK